MLERLRTQVGKEDRDLTILRVIVADGPIGIVKLAERTGLPEHKVRYSLRMLENDGFVEPTPNGAIPAEDVEAQLRHVNSGIDDLTGRLETVQRAFEDE